MERGHRAVLTLFTGETLVSGAPVWLEAGASHHVEVRRAKVGDAVRLLNGIGAVATGSIIEHKKGEVAVTIDTVQHVPAPPPLEVIVPVADRDRMLMAAEKCVELQITAWRPALFARSRSVGTRGEGEKFRQKIHARMQSALEQCGGAWLPVMHAEIEAVRALEETQGDTRFILEANGASLLSQPAAGSVALAVGPEGGFVPGELDVAAGVGWKIAALGATTLRFETAIIAGVAVIRAAQFRPGRG